MGSPKEHDRLFSAHAENSEIDVSAAGTDITYYFKTSGIDSDTAIYMGMARNAYGLDIRPSAIIKIISINDKVLKDPIVVNTTGYISTLIEVNKIVVRTLSASTNIKVFAC